MNLVLSPELAKYVESQVTAGWYASPEDVIAAALARLMQDEAFGEFAQGELDTLVAEGEADVVSGNLVEGDEVFRKFRERHVP